MRAWIVALALAGCHAQSKPAVVVGAPLPTDAVTPLASVMASPDAYAGKAIVTEGLVRAACQQKGCWMELVPKAGDAIACRIRFKDYAFFVPKDSPGSTAKLAGEVGVRLIPPAEVAHYEGEGAKLDKLPDGSARAVEITATGVELRRL